MLNEIDSEKLGSYEETFEEEDVFFSGERLEIFNIFEFLNLDIPLREKILDPIIQLQSLIMIFARPGIGKTLFALAMGYAIASGGKFLKWHAPKPRRVLYIDGEMPATAMQERLRDIVKNSVIKAAPDHFLILTPDMQIGGMPDLSTKSGQDMLEPYIQDADVIIVDNLSTLARSGKENEGEGWLPVQEWALRLRSLGKCVIFIHHAGKGGQQRGTSRREDVLDLIIELKRPNGYKSDEGARVEVHFTKSRHIAGTDAGPFGALFTPYGWSMQDIEEIDITDNEVVQSIIRLKAENLSIREIAEQLNISKSMVGRIAKKVGIHAFVPPSHS